MFKGQGRGNGVIGKNLNSGKDKILWKKFSVRIASIIKWLNWTSTFALLTRSKQRNAKRKIAIVSAKTLRKNNRNAYFVSVEAVNIRW